MHLYIYGVFYRMSETIKKEGDKYKSDTDLFHSIVDGFLFDITRDFMESSSVEMMNKNKDKMAKNAIDFVKKQLSSLEQIKLMKNSFSLYKATSEKYTYDVAYKIFKDKNNKNRISLFAKTILLADDYCNADKLLKFRNMLYSSKYLDDEQRACFKMKNPTKDVFSIFKSDCELLNIIINDFNTYKCYDYDEIKKLDSYVLWIVYSRFIINMFIYLHEERPQTLGKDDNKAKLEKKLEFFKFSIVLSKIYNILDTILFAYALRSMSEMEIMCFFFEKIRDEIAIHFYPLIGFDRVHHSASIKEGIPRATGAAKYDPIIYEIYKEGCKEWEAGCTYNQIDMLNYLERNEKYGKFLRINEIKDKVNTLFKQYLSYNDLKYIQGKDECHQSKLEFTTRKAKRNKKVNKNSDAKNE